MKNTFIAFGLLISILSVQPVFALTQTYQVKQQDIYAGYITEKIWLNDYARPGITISGISYEASAALPKGAVLSHPEQFKVILGMDRKRPFAVVHIPAYVAGDAPGQVKQVSGFTLTVDEAAPAKKIAGAAKTTDVTTSVLATGTWYKVAVTKTGFCKIDNNFIATLSPKPANGNVNNMRVYGNGGRMLSENNTVARPSDLLENALMITDNGASAIFYAVGTTAWKLDTGLKIFTHDKNIYSDTSFYFITFDKGPGLRVSDQGAIGAANKTVTDFDYYDVHDTDAINPVQLGKIWFGEGFYPQANNTSQSFNFDLGAAVGNISCNVSFGHTSQITGSRVEVLVNGQMIGSETFSNSTTNGTDNVMSMLTNRFSGPCNSQNAKVTIDFLPADAASIGYLDYIEINARRSLLMTGDQMSFRDMQSAGSGNIASYQLQGANGNTRVWDVTNPQVPVQMNGALNGNVFSFTQDAGSVHEFAAMNGTSQAFITPRAAGVVPNQNLHASGQVDCIIVTYPDFLPAAERLAKYHREHDNMRVIVATTKQIYNEFSSGAQDLSAIRDFGRMFYLRAGNSVAQMPKYMILFGGASYDYKNRLANNSNFVPVFEYAPLNDGLINDLSSFCSDDFYGFLDDSENIDNDNVINALDIGVGRLPARSIDDANNLVDKIISYTDSATLGPWRIATTVVADNNDDAGQHLDVAEHMAQAVTAKANGLYNIDKVYLDAIPTVSTPAGDRCPNANAALNNDVFKGVFAINYNGHGNTQIWAGERILTQDDYNSWGNKNMLPFMVTATCDFGQFDHPQYVSAAEQLVIRSGGGVIAMITTTQAVFSTYNETLNLQYLSAQFNHNTDGSWNSFGEASRLGKNDTYTKPIAQHDAGETANYRKFGLLGDPALTPDFPQFNIKIDDVVENTTKQHTDSVKALGAYAVSGSVHDNSGNLMPGFNGLVWVSIYDKPRTVNTIRGTGETFRLQDNIVYKGKASVVNGRFTFTFITPKDINYFYGTGKISTYAHNGIIDAAGTDTSIKVGGYSDHPQLSAAPPVVKPYIGDTLFRNGGITGNNTSLYATLYDETGINVSGNNVGHDLTAVLDDNVELPYLLNDYYETEPNTYQRGHLSFPLTGLANGRHTITVRAWDVNDNMGLGKVDFVVVDGQVVDISNLANYPNPFSNTTHFVFEHNHPDELLDVQINIYSAAGALVKEIKDSFTPVGSRTAELTWDGTDNSNTRLPSGIYIYRVNISTPKGFKSSAYQKLVIVR